MAGEWHGTAPDAGPGPASSPGPLAGTAPRTGATGSCCWPGSPGCSGCPRSAWWRPAGPRSRDAGPPGLNSGLPCRADARRSAPVRPLPTLPPRHPVPEPPHVLRQQPQAVHAQGQVFPVPAGDVAGRQHGPLGGEAAAGAGRDVGAGRPRRTHGRTLGSAKDAGPCFPALPTRGGPWGSPPRPRPDPAPTGRPSPGRLEWGHSRPASRLTREARTVRA